MTDSVSTASTPDDIKTPDSTGLTGFHFHLDENPVAGPTGPHLFRPVGDGAKQRSSPEIEIILDDTPISATTPRYRYASKLDPKRTDIPVPEKAAKQKRQVLISSTATEPIVAAAASWTPQEVVTWMQKIGMDEGIVEKFFINDISGSVLLDLQSEDLKELEIHSFGKRHRLMTSIRQLRNSILLPSHSSQDEVLSVESDPIAREESSTPESAIAVVGTGCSGSPITEDEQPPVQARQHGQRRRRRRPQAINPDDSISIVAIEQLLPKLHTCSKGEECRKWQKQQAKLARIARDFPTDSLGCGNAMVLRGDPGNAATAQNLVKSPKSEVTPSIVASSDALGPNQAAQQYPLSEDKLNIVEPRDPQENVRHFINFQRLSRLQPVNDPATPPRETFPSPNGGSPNSVRANASLSENLRHLPKLRIPSTHLSVSESSANLSAQRTITPSILRKKTPFADQSTYGREKSPTPYSSVFSPSEFYRQHPHYNQSTPLSEVDVPLTAIPLGGPVERIFSQSVPPDMRFGSDGPIARPPSTKAENHRRNTSFQNTPNFRVLRRLDEGQTLPPIETPEDLENTPRAAHCRSNPFGQCTNDVTHSGWMKKRKTTRFLRREWEEHHFALRGTQLAMFPDEDASRRNSKALEQIDVDDYAVACSSLPSNSKLTAAFKKTVLKRNDNQTADAAFAFSLIPSSPNGSTDRKASLLNGPKSHHFAVKTRDERIDWMRELMLAKALKKGRDSGATLNMNGSMI